VAGGIALLKCAYPEATPQELKAALLYTADDLGPGGDDNEYGMGRINMMNAYNFLAQTLISDTKELSLTAKQKDVIFSLDAGAANAGRFYSLLASLSGSAPGTTLPGGLNMPLNMDIITDLSIIYSNGENFQNFSGTLGDTGGAVANLYVGRLLDDPAFIGTVITFAFILWPGPGFDFASNAWDVEVAL
jgi:hypothetical protein